MKLKKKYTDPLGVGGNGYRTFKKAAKYDAPEGGTKIYTSGLVIPARPRVGNRHGPTPKRPGGTRKLCRRKLKALGWAEGGKEYVSKFV